MSFAYNREAPNVHPPYACPAYVSTHQRAPGHEPIPIDHSLSEITGPRFTRDALRAGDEDLTRFSGGQALGERLIVGGRVLDEAGRAIAATLVEIWQANAAGRYAHDSDRHDAPLDPHFCGIGRAFTDGDGRYRFITIRPGAYPWANHANAWRPAHVHFSVFGPGFATRLVTQMYFPGDPLLALDPIFNSVPDAHARQRLIANFDQVSTVANYALAYNFELVLRGRMATPMEPG